MGTKQTWRVANHCNTYDGYITKQKTVGEKEGVSELRYSDESFTKTVSGMIKSAFGVPTGILSAGTRAAAEIEFLETVCDPGSRVIGCDLVENTNSHENIIICDMHKLEDKFSENEFDIMYSAHVLEHSLNPRAHLSQVKKICRRGAAMVLPNMIGMERGPTIGHPLWVKCLTRRKLFTMLNVQLWMDDMMGVGFCEVESICEVSYKQKHESIYDYMVCIKWQK